MKYIIILILLLIVLYVIKSNKSNKKIVINDDYDYVNGKKIFTIGNRVQFHSGGLGTVVNVYKGESPICTVLWDDIKDRGNIANSNIEGENYSISLPVYDMDDKFNPIIRRAKYFNYKL